MRIALDGNVVVRYLTWDDGWQASEAANAIEAANGRGVPTIVLCELLWVLKRAYRYAGPDITAIFRHLVGRRGVKLKHPAAEAGIAMLARGGDFADGVIRHEADCAKCDRLVTFDQGFARHMGRDKVVLLRARPLG